MILPRLVLAAALLLGTAGGASAAPVSQGSAPAPGSAETAWAKGGGWGKKGWKGGRHYGWQRGRHLGWRKHRRAYRGDAVRRAYRPAPYGYAPYGYAPRRPRSVTIRF